MSREIEVVFQPLLRQSVSADPGTSKMSVRAADVEILKEFLLTKMPALDEKKLRQLSDRLYRTQGRTPSSFPKLGDR